MYPEKTIFRNKYLKKLSLVNDQLCYFQFAYEEVLQRINKLNIKDQTKLTTEVFPNNIFSKKIKVEFGELECFQAKSIAITTGISMSFGIEQLLYYLDDIINLKKTISLTTESPEKKKDDVPEDIIFKNLKFWGIKKPEPAIQKTIKYLRLRRNHIVHSNTVLSEKLEQTIRKDSHHLTSYWSTKISLNGFDFSKKDVDNFTTEEAYICMNLLRICLKEIDTMITSTFKNKDLIIYQTKEILLGNNSLKGSEKALNRKVKRLLNDNFGLVVTDTQEYVKETLKEMFEDK